jgi:hypothetical protein
MSDEKAKLYTIVTAEQMARYSIFMLSGKAGRSVRLISDFMFGENQSAADVASGPPSDAGDFQRCIELLGIFPQWRQHLQKLAQTYQRWARLVRDWDLLEALLKAGRKEDFQRVLDAVRAGVPA